MSQTQQTQREDGRHEVLADVSREVGKCGSDGLDPTLDAFDDGTRVQDLGSTHFIGVGGSGMSVLAQMLLAEGVSVTGSDLHDNAKTARLRELGATVWVGQDARHVQGAQTVVFSSAITPDNPEIIAAKEQGLRIVHRSDILSLLMHRHRSVAVAGAHGKTTTSALLAHIIATAGHGDLADPSYAIGGSLRQSDGAKHDGGHTGSGNVFIAEADESDGSFLKYHPSIAIITHAGADHLDHYRTEERYRAAFRTFAAHATDCVIASVDDPGALDVIQSLDADTSHRVIAYSTRASELADQLNVAHLVPIVSEVESAGSGHEHFMIELPDGLFPDVHARKLHVELQIPGIHNARNATAAILAAVALGVDPEAAALAAGSFLGAVGRFQVLGVRKQVTVVEDYAHHPTEITALLEAARRRYPGSTLRVIFQPHLFSRTQFFAPEFARALSLADDVLVTGVFPARERQEDFPGVGPQTIVEAAEQILSDRPAGWINAVSDMQLSTEMMAMRAHHGDVVFMVGAGDISSMGSVLLHALEAHRNGCEE